MAVTVTEMLKQILLDQMVRTIDGQEAARRILNELRKQVVTEIATAPAGSFAGYQYQNMLREIDRHLAVADRSLKSELTTGIRESWDAGVGMLPQLAKAGSDITIGTYGISTHLVDQIKEFSWGKISGITNDLQAKIRAELSLGILGGKTPQDVAAAIAGSLDDKPGVFKSVTERAEVIVKTEMGRTYSMAHQASMDAAAETLPEMQKMWLHAGHPKTPRIYHLRLNGDVKPINEPFLVGNISMMYPRDPTAPVSEIINCGCMHVAYMPEWGTRKQIVKSWADAQKEANKPRGDYNDGKK